MRKRGQFHDHPLQNDMLSSLPHPPLVSLYLSQLSYALLFCFWQEKTADMKHFPTFFLIFDKACEDKSERGGVPFFFPPTANQQNITAPLLWRDHLTLKGPNSICSTFFETPEMNVVKGHEEHILYCLLKLQHFTDSILFFDFKSSHFPHFFVAYKPCAALGVWGESIIVI